MVVRMRRKIMSYVHCLYLNSVISNNNSVSTVKMCALWLILMSPIELIVFVYLTFLSTNKIQREIKVPFATNTIIIEMGRLHYENYPFLLFESYGTHN
jgi:hypothetical protein